MPFHYEHEQLLICKFTNIKDNEDGCNLKLENFEKFAIRAMKGDFFEEIPSGGIYSILIYSILLLY